jgi:hypothetical protein
VHEGAAAVQEGFVSWPINQARKKRFDIALVPSVF